jgi:replication fork protection complex subunit Csm3/Swi3
LAMVEKAGHKSTMMRHRMEWIEDEKRKEFTSLEQGSFDLGFSGENQLDDDDIVDDDVAPVTEGPSHSIAQRPRPKTPQEFDPLDGADLYGTSPQKAATAQPTMAPEEPEDDDLEALMREADESSPTASRRKEDDSTNKPTQPTANEFEDEEAAMAEMEGLW